MKINIVLPFFNQDPVGGIKVMYEYANALCNRGHDVVIYHAMYTRWMPKGGQGFRKQKNRFFQHILRLKRRKRPAWFQLNNRIKSFEIIDVSNDLIRNADILFCTWWATAIEVSELKSSKGVIFNLIQDAEDIMTDHKNLVYESYRLPVNHIVIAKYLAPIIASHGGKVAGIIPNAVDTDEFCISHPIMERDPFQIIMLYAEVERKGTTYGLKALEMLMPDYPQLTVNLFGVVKPPIKVTGKNFHYYYRPANLAELYNNSAIFISPSIHEGWGLPAMEAMACGCACICTNVEGHLDFMDNGVNALLTEPGDSLKLAEHIRKLITDKTLRLSLAYNAGEKIKEFSWGKSADMLENLFRQSSSAI